MLTTVSVRRAIGALLLGSALAAAPALAAPSRQEAANTKLVLAMWKGVIQQADVAAVLKYISPDYIQHNVNVPEGRPGLLVGIKQLHDRPPGVKIPAHKELMKVVAKDDIVVLFWNQAQP